MDSPIHKTERFPFESLPRPEEQEPGVFSTPISSGPRLVGLEGEYIGTVYPIPGTVTQVGRSADNTVVLLADRRISRHHLLIEGEGGQYCLTDLGSTNGTLLNNERIPAHTPQPLLPGDVIQIGMCRFRFEA
jgi:pSer/pThr/pTyr-binding forkhead associated (FHA) protein